MSAVDLHEVARLRQDRADLLHVLELIASYANATTTDRTVNVLGKVAAGALSAFENVDREPETFAEWLGRHCSMTGVQVPRAGSPRRRLLSRVYAAFEEAGWTLAVQARGMEAGEPERAIAAVWGAVVAEFQVDEERAQDPKDEPTDV